MNKKIQHETPHAYLREQTKNWNNKKQKKPHNREKKEHHVDTIRKHMQKTHANISIVNISLVCATTHNTCK